MTHISRQKVEPEMDETLTQILKSLRLNGLRLAAIEAECQA